MTRANQSWFEDVAIIGMSGRFPGARNIGEYWENLRHGVESIRPFTEEELRKAGVSSAQRALPNFVNAGAVLEDIELFDAAFFKIGAREAESMDPQQRIMLETAWETLENGGYDPFTYPGKIGVFSGSRYSTYFHQVRVNAEFLALVGGYQLMIGNDKDQVSNHVAYALNLRGPAVNVQTACSTSLVAVVTACMNLRLGLCDMALAGGVSIDVPQTQGYLYREGGINSPDGRCRAFDAKANGMVGGNAVGLVLLKPLKDAIRDRDHVYAVIRGAAMNNDGGQKSSYAAPSVAGEIEVITQAHASGGIDPATISYVEAHGTATHLGDPIEVEGLTKAFRLRTDKQNYCAIGSVKTNIGHCDPAAGVASLIKTALMLQHGEIAPSLNFDTPNPHIDFENSPFFVNTRLTKWLANGSPRRAGINAFGIGGTNAHLILEESPTSEPRVPLSDWNVIPLSARSSEALQESSRRLAKELRTRTDLNLGDVAFTCQTGRHAFAHRLAAVCGPGDDAASVLDRQDAQHVVSGKSGTAQKVAFLFPGQGSQYAGMGAKLYESEKVFRESIDLCAETLKPQLGLDLRHLLFPADVLDAEAGARLAQTSITQPAIFAIEFALAQLWKSWGIEPSAMVGHSIGEFTAACIAGVMRVEDALRLVAHRGSLMQSCEPGKMLSVQLPEADMAAYLAAADANLPISIAVVNSPDSTVVAGPNDAILALREGLERSGIVNTVLRTSHAFHSAMMDPILGRFRYVVESIELSAPQIPYISNLTGDWIRAEEATSPDYWVRHLRETVRFSDAAARLTKETGFAYLECGPGSTLSNHIRQSSSTSGALTVASLRATQDPVDDRLFVRKSLARMWTWGIPVDWHVVDSSDRRKVPLPTYPFERKRFWVELPAGAIESAPAEAPPKTGRNIADQFNIPVWRPSPSPAISNAPIAPGAWLVFSNGDDFSNVLMDQLRLEGTPVVEILAGEELAISDNGSHQVRAERVEDYEAILAHLRRNGIPISSLVYLWPLRAEEAPIPGGTPDRSHFYSLIALQQALSSERANTISLTVVCEGLHMVAPDDKIQPRHALLLGPVKVGAEEYPHLKIKLVDFKPGDDSADAARLLRSEIENGDQPITVYRGSQRFTQAFDHILLNPGPGQEPRLRPQGTYLITGGTGGIGLSIADYLGSTYKARLILTCRSEFPPPEQWDALLEKDNTTSQAIQVFRAIEKAGGTVQIFSADVADFDAMRRVVDEGSKTLGAIRGVIHCAGTAGGGMIELKTRKSAEPVLRPKVDGLHALEAALAGTQLDFLVFCSSLASVTGGFGRVDYVSANAYVDAYAWSLAAKGYPATSINWPAWRDVGMAVNAPMPAEMETARRKSLERGLFPAEGVEAFVRIVSAFYPQIVIAPPEPVPVAMAEEQAPAPAKANALSTVSAHSRPELSVEYVAAGGPIESAIAKIWEQVLGVEPIGRNDDFFELGGHSLLAIQIASSIRQAFGIEVPLRQLFEYPTVGELSPVVEDLLTSELDKLSDEEVRRELAASAED